MLTWAGDVSGDVGLRVASVAARWRDERPERQARRHLEPADFEELRATGLLRLVVPADEGGGWVDMPTSTRPIAEIYRSLARADASVALVSVMHPAVLAFWLASPDPTNARWEAQ